MRTPLRFVPRLEYFACDARVQLVAQRTTDVEVSEEDMRKAFDKVCSHRVVIMVVMVNMAIITTHTQVICEC